MHTEGTLSDFHPAVRQWFAHTYGSPTPPQTLGWPSISAGKNTLILAPTGSGKTLAAFLWAINHLVEQYLSGEIPKGVRILYISPLKALNNDIGRNLEGPLEGIRRAAEESGLDIPPIRTGIRTGDTPQSARAAMQRKPPDILITTPESLYLMLTSGRSRGMFRTVQYVIVDEIHAMCGNKRGVHLSLSLERLQEAAEQEFVRIGLSATQRPLERIAAFLGGLSAQGGATVPRPVTIIDAGHRKTMDLRVECAPADFALLTPEGVWPLIFTEILALVRLHRTTLIFVNNRRLAERVAAALNDLAGGPPTEEMNDGRTTAINLHAPLRAAPNDAERLVQAYHGSMSRDAREKMESDLKGGKIRGLVATSSLELGIDIGSIDLVVQLQSPRGIARGLQRIGRSGHLVTATSKGRIFPTHREDLVESVVVSGGIAAHEVEESAVPENCLDVLAQQIVAMVSVEERDPDDLYRLVRQSYCYRDLSRMLFDGVIRMISGRYAEGTLRELRGIVSWDRVNGVLRALPGTLRRAVTGGGTIADRGYYGVYLGDGKTKVGEVDEEFVYETRNGDTFILGSSVWRVEEIDANRITVSPAPGQPARMPFWKGEGIGRSYELGVQVGRFRRSMEESLDAPDSLSRLRNSYPIDSHSAWNIREYFRRQRDATGVIPHDGRMLVESFRDEIGDPRIVIHSSFGRKVNGLLGLFAARRMQDLTGSEPQMLYNDDGILLRPAEAGPLPPDIFDGIDAEEARTLVLDEVLASPLFGGQFRQNASRALLMGRTAPGKRTPLWLQRLRAADILQIARRYDDFPIVIETVREILNDVLDFGHFTEILRGIARGTIEVAHASTEIPSPFAASLIFDFIAVYMYQSDQPREDRLSQYLAINREILGEIIDKDTLSSLVRPEAVEIVDARLQHRADGTRARSPEELMEIFLRIGDLTTDEARARCDGDHRAMLRILEEDGRIVQVQCADGPRWIAAEERELYAPGGPAQDTAFLVGRYVRNHGPLTSAEIGRRFGAQAAETERIVSALADSSELIRGNFTARGEDPEWCQRGTLESIHRQTISVLRHEITPSTPAEFASFLFRWQGVRDGGNGIDIASALGRLEGLPLPAEAWERDILRARVSDITPEALTHFTSGGYGAWVGSGAGRLRFIFRGNGGLILEPESAETPGPEEAGQGPRLREPARRIREYIGTSGASFFSDIREGTGLSLEGMNGGIAELFWNGIVTNDVFAEVAAVRRPARSDEPGHYERIEIVNPLRAPQRGRIMQAARRALRQVPGWTGRWSLVRTPGMMGKAPSAGERARGQAGLLLERYGIVAREFLGREDLLPWGLIAQELARMELKGEIRRGYFIEGLSGMQFALPSAVEELRKVRSERARPAVVLLNACDPANPYGPGFDFPSRETGGAPLRATRAATAYIAFEGGTPFLLFESSGARIRSIGSAAPETVRRGLELFIALMKLPGAVRPFREIVVEYCDDVRPAQSPLGDALGALGFIRDSNQTMRRDEYS